MSETTPERPAPEESAGGTPMHCPKCGAEMRTHQRNGVTIEQCRRCHGIFLDRGEFEQLLARETSYFGSDLNLAAPGAGGGGRASRWKRWRR